MSIFTRYQNHPDIMDKYKLDEDNPKIRYRNYIRFITDYIKNNDINWTDKHGYNALENTSDYEYAKALIKMGIDVEHINKKSNNTILFYENDIRIVQLVLNNCKDPYKFVNYINSDGRNALFTEHDIPIIKLLIKYGIDTKIVNRYSSNILEENVHPMETILYLTRYVPLTFRTLYILLHRYPSDKPKRRLFFVLNFYGMNMIKKYISMNGNMEILQEYLEYRKKMAGIILNHFIRRIIYAPDSGLSADLIQKLKDQHSGRSITICEAKSRTTLITFLVNAIDIFQPEYYETFIREYKQKKENYPAKTLPIDDMLPIDEMLSLYPIKTVGLKIISRMSKFKLCESIDNMAIYIKTPASI